MEFGLTPEAAAQVTSAVKAVTTLPLIVKLTPNVTDIKEIAVAVEEVKADAVCLINTIKAMAIDINERKPCLGNITGGLSGPAIKTIALYMVYEVAKVVSIPVIGCGGIASGEDALEFIMAGASAVQVGTANLTNPRASLDVLQGIERFMKTNGITNLVDIIGAARR